MNRCFWFRSHSVCFWLIFTRISWQHPEETSNGVGGLLHYFYLLDEWSILPSLIFYGCRCDDGLWSADCKSDAVSCLVQQHSLVSYAAYFLAILMGFNGKAAAAISIIGGADGPTSIFLAGKAGTVRTDGTDRSGSIFLYVTGADHSAAYHEASDHRERT